MKIICFVAVALTLSFSSCQQKPKKSIMEEIPNTAEYTAVDAADSHLTDGISEETEVESTSESSEGNEYARINQECLGAKDGYFSDLNKYCNRKDEEAVGAGVAAGIFTVLEPGRCSIVDKEFGKTKVRVNGEEWWVSSEFVD